jgi:hypothetical protein
MKHLSSEQLYFTLKAGRSIEQWLGHEDKGHYILLKWLTIYAEKDGDYSVSYFEVFDEGSRSFIDIYEFGAIDPDEEAIDTFSTFQEALNFSMSKYGCAQDGFVNEGMIQDEYVKYLDLKGI